MPIFDVDERKDVKVFYHNVAYKANRMAINVEKMKVCELFSRCFRTCEARISALLVAAVVQILKERLGDCVRNEGVNYIDKCEQVRR